MKGRTLFLLASAAVYLSAYAALAVGPRFSAPRDPHSFMKDPGRCANCHLEPVPGPARPYRQINFRKDISTLCSGCHARPVSHPVDIAPGREMARDLPLDPDGTMTCVTCHAPHAAPYGDRPHTGRSLVEKVRDTAFPFLPSRHRTCFLRIPSTRGELCEACHARGTLAGARDTAAVDPGAYAGSAACAKCHPGEYQAWRLSAHARMLRSPRRDPKALLARFSGTPPFPPSEVAYVLGSRNVQRFVSRRGDDFVVRTPIWLIRANSWNLAYWREMDWLKTCAGCHTTGCDAAVGRFAEESVSCEACHGPGRAHALSGSPAAIVNPAKLPPDRRAMICEACHTTGHDASGEFRFPVGYRPGDDLGRFFFGLTPKPGQDDASFKGDGSAGDRDRQYRFWRERMLIADGETCDLCKNFRLARGQEARGPRTLTTDEFCLSCHDGTVTPPPRHHGRTATAGRHCLSCHPADRALSGEVSIHDHRYIPAEALAKNDFIPPHDFRSICFGCHPVPSGERSLNR